MKILLFSSTDDPKNGYGNITRELCSTLASQVDLTLLLPQNEPERGVASYRISHVLPPYIFDLKTPKILDYLLFHFDASSYDIIHSLFEFPYALIAARLAKKYHKPLIIGTQGTYAIQPLFRYPERWLMQWVYNSAALITAPSKFTKENIRNFSGTNTLIEIVHNGVNFERFNVSVDVSDIRARYPGKKLLLTVGGLKPRKGQDLVIQALAKMKKHDDVHYLIIGEGKMKKTLEKLAVSMQVSDRVSFLGALEGQELVRYFHACDIYVHTPILVNWQFEGFGIVYLEASSCRKPIIATNSGGVRDAVLDGRTGIVVPESDVAAIAQAVERLLDDPISAQRLGNQGWEYARQHAWGMIGQKYEELYKEILK